MQLIWRRQKKDTSHLGAGVEQSQSLYRGRAWNCSKSQSLERSSGMELFQVPEPRVKLRIFPSPRDYMMEEPVGLFPNSRTYMGGAKSNISTYFFKFIHDIFLHIFDIIFLHIFQIFLHVFHIFLPIPSWVQVIAGNFSKIFNVPKNIRGGGVRKIQFTPRPPPVDNRPSSRM